MDKIRGILLIYHHPLKSDAATIMDHVKAFGENSSFRVWTINTALGFPRALKRLRFSAIVLHYSLFGWYPFSLYRPFFEYVEKSRESYKVAFFQDEYRFWPERTALLSALDVHCVYTLVEPQHFADTYEKHCKVRRLVYNLPAYVSADMVKKGREVFKLDSERTVDIGYRGRQPPYYLGKGAQEKHLIGINFLKRAGSLGLRLDIETEEEKRIYGTGWFEFLANCRAVLGVEAGTTIFDIDNLVRPKYSELCNGNPDLVLPGVSFSEVYESILAAHEDRIYYRTISARHFEAAALRVCQILFEGKYSGVLIPMIHYIPLKRDFSNLAEVIDMFGDAALRKQIAENAYADLIASGKYNYRHLIGALDRDLLDLGITPDIDVTEARRISRLVRQSVISHFIKKAWYSLRQRDFPGRNILKPVAKPILKKLGI